MRRFHRGRKLPAFAGKDARSSDLDALLTSLEEPLHAQADSEEWLPGRSGFEQGSTQAAAVQSTQRGKMSYSGEYDLVCCREHFRLVRHHDFSAEIGKCLFHGIQIARAVIHDDDHRSPLVLGSMRPRRRSREHATRRARANALKSASIL